jgi:hypothetical protein
MNGGDVRDIDGLQAEERLFVASDDDWMNNACVNFGYPEEGYVGGFLRAADLAVEHVISTGTDQDYLVYPIVFGYRQYLELRLKGLLRDASNLLNEPAPSDRLMGKHKLIPLWRELRPLLDRVFSAESDQLDLIGGRIEEFSEMDPDSYTFRYATTKIGTLSLPEDLRHINLAHLRTVMAKIALMLDGADVGISVYLENKADMLEYLLHRRTD